MRRTAPKTVALYGASLGILCAGFVLCRYALFGIHHMRDWPPVLFLFGLFVLGVSFLAGATLVPVVASLFYTIGFGAGLVFRTQGLDPGGGATDNLWIIWAVVLVCAVLSSALGEAFKKRAAKRSPKEG